MKLKNLLIAFLLGIALAAGLYTALQISARNAELAAATVLPSPAELPSFALVDHDGNSVDDGVFRGHWNLVFFGFTHCPDICPATLQILSVAKRQLAADGARELPRIVLVSVDPERDTPEQLDMYIGNFGDDNLGLTGELDEIRKLTSALGIFFDKQDTDDEYYAVDHSSVVIVIDPDGQYRALFSSPHTIENYVRDVPLLMKL